jgi:hypothetical protein
MENAACEVLIIDRFFQKKQMDSDNRLPGGDIAHGRRLAGSPGPGFPNR